MSSPSPPKPWERRAHATATSSALSAPHSKPHLNSTATPASPTATATSQQPPALPSRSPSFSNFRNLPTSSYSPYGPASRLGSTPYSSIGSYSSPYSRYGGMGNSLYGGGYGSMYGGIGGMGMGGIGGMYGGMGGPGGMVVDPNDPNSLTNSFSQSTQATFQIIEGIVGAFGGFAQMLESTYMATHSSFFAMISVAEQFANLRNTLGSILGIFTILRWLRTFLAKITGRPPPADATSLTPSAFASFRGLSTPYSSSHPPTPSKKPFIVFLLAAFGLPYLLSKLIRSLSSPVPFQDTSVLGPHGTQLLDQAIDPSKLEFCRVLFDYDPPSRTAKKDISVRKGDLVAVLEKKDPMGNPSDWWQCRARDGRMGYLPGVYLDPIQRKPKEIGDRRAEALSISSTDESFVVEGAAAKGKGILPDGGEEKGKNNPKGVS